MSEGDILKGVLAGAAAALIGAYAGTYAEKRRYEDTGGSEWMDIHFDINSESNSRLADFLRSDPDPDFIGLWQKLKGSSKVVGFSDVSIPNIFRAEFGELSLTLTREDIQKAITKLDTKVLKDANKAVIYVETPDDWLPRIVQEEIEKHLKMPTRVIATETCPHYDATIIELVGLKD
jgi:hypothetical protein